jgi:hypothetical protein
MFSKALGGSSGPLAKRKLVATLNLNTPEFRTSPLENYLAANTNEGIIYILAERDDQGNFKQILKVGQTTRTGKTSWTNRVSDYRSWALAGEYWKPGQTWGQQLTFYAFAVPLAELTVTEKNVRQHLWNHNRDKSPLYRDYDFLTANFRTQDSTYPHPKGELNGRRYGFTDQAEPSSLNIPNLFANTSFAGLVRHSLTTSGGTLEGMIDLNNQFGRGPNSNGWATRIAELQNAVRSDEGLAADSVVQWIYILEDRDAPADRRILKIGSTGNSQVGTIVTVENANDHGLVSRISGGGAVNSYRSWAIHRQRLTIHLFRPEAVRAAGQLAATTSLVNIEKTLREAVYGTGKHFLPEDHTGDDVWRTGLGVKTLHFTKGDKPKPKPFPKFYITGLGES